MPSEPANDLRQPLAKNGKSPNPYAPTTTALEAFGDAWPYDLPRAKSRRVRQIAVDANRAALSLIGATFLGLVGPIFFTIFFVGHLWSYDRLVRQYPDLINPSQFEYPLARSFAKARNKLVVWARLYGLLLIAELVGLAFMLLS